MILTLIMGCGGAGSELNTRNPLNIDGLIRGKEKVINIKIDKMIYKFMENKVDDIVERVKVNQSTAYLAGILENSSLVTNKEAFYKIFENAVKNESLKLSNPGYEVSEKQFREIMKYM